MTETSGTTAADGLCNTGWLNLAARTTGVFSSIGKTSSMTAAGASEGRTRAEEIWAGGVTGVGAVVGKAGRGIEGGGLYDLARVGKGGRSENKLDLASSGVLGGEGEAVLFVEDAFDSVLSCREED